LPWCAISFPAPGEVELRGTVRDQATGLPVASAIVRVLGTSRGTVVNMNGEFVLRLEPGPSRILVSSVGYRPDTASLMLSHPLRLDVELVPAEILLPEIVVTSEDPAMAIMRQVIARKKRWMERLHTYTIDAFTRQTIRRDTSIAAIAESFTNGYWQAGDTLREIVRQKRQTSNLSMGENFASVGRILNFYENRIRFVGYSFVGPAADDALDSYRYTLERTRRDGPREVYEIALHPRRRTRPLFRGTIAVDGDSYALIGVEVEPNEAFVLPFVKDQKVDYRQQFGLYEQEFWMPADIRIDASFTIAALGLALPRIGIEQTSVITNYRINVPLPDTIFAKPRLSADSSAALYDSTFWTTSQILPLDREEQRAYATLDSTQKLEVQFRPGGLAATLGGDAGTAGLDLLDLSFNRVEGLHAGLRLEDAQWLPGVSLRGGLSIGSADRTGKYEFGLTLFTSARRTLGVGIDLYRELERCPDGGYYGPLFNSFTALLAKSDYGDYFLARGWKVFLQGKPTSTLRWEIALLSEDERSAIQHTDFSLFFPSQSYRANGPIRDGHLGLIRGELHLGHEPLPLELLVHNSLDIALEHSDPSLSSSDFRYTRVEARGTLIVPTFGSEFLLRPSLKIRVLAGGSFGDLPPQRWFNVDSRSACYGPFGVLRTLGVRALTGTSVLAMTLEQNFRSVPFLALGVPFLYENGIELLVHGGVARSWMKLGMAEERSPGWVAEAGFGFGRLFELFRLDASWKLTAPALFCVTVAVAGID
jgi:hypothetical protein